MIKYPKHSLWLIPPRGVYTRLEKIISDLSREHQAPIFRPHVTLLASVPGSEKEVIKNAHRFSRLIKPFDVTLTSVDYSDQYFRCLFIRARKSRALMDANLRARGIFGKQSDEKYMPHLSLMYGNFQPEVKESIIEKIGRDFNITFTARCLCVDSEGEDIEGWRVIKEFKLGRIRRISS